MSKEEQKRIPFLDPQCQKSIDPPPPPEVFKVSSKLQQFTTSDFLTSYDLTDYIGCGSFGAVRKSIHSELGKVVVKCASLTGTKQSIDKGINGFKRETSILVRVRHPNIVRIFGVTIWSNNVGIVLECLDGGNLDSFLKRDQIKHIDWWIRTMFAHQLVAALAFLHSHDSHIPFSHGDIKPLNILLSRQLVIKLADFGAANIIRATHVESTTLDISSTRQHTVLYAAPECLDGEFQISTSAMDMYSYAMVLYEIITRVTIYNGFNRPIRIVTLRIGSGLRPRQDEIDSTLRSIDNESDKRLCNVLINVMKKCWKGKAQERPSSFEVRNQLGMELVEMDVAHVANQIKLLQAQMQKLNETKEASALSKLSSFAAPFQQANPSLQWNAGESGTAKLESSKREPLPSQLDTALLSLSRRHWFKSQMHHSSSETGKESVLLLSHKKSFTDGYMWRVKFLASAQGRNRPYLVHGSVSKMDVFSQYVFKCTWQEAYDALQSHFSSVEKSSAPAPGPSANQKADPVSNKFAFSLTHIVHPDKSKLSEVLLQKGLRIKMWKHPSRFLANGIVTSQIGKWELENIATLLGKVFGKVSINFVQSGFDEGRWMGEDGI